MYTSKELANMWKVDISTINRLITSGKIAAVRVGGQWRVTEKGLQEYLKKHTTKALSI